MSPAPAVSLEQVSFAYDGGPTVLEEVQVDIGAGEFLGLVGPNGGGKSTLLKIILGLLQPTRGKVSVYGQAPLEGQELLGYVPQYPTFTRDFPISVENAVLLGRLGRTRRLGGYLPGDRKQARQAMEETGIGNLRERRLNTLSGGQLQRVLIARALVGDPRMLILDEPTANIDLRAEEDIFDLFRELNRRMTLVVVSHDVGFISHYVTRVACLNRTLVCHETADISGETIAELYGTPVRMIGHMH